jgi:hypothetical protein
MSSYLRTKLATDFEPSSLSVGVRVLRKLLFFVPDANPDYEPKLHLVREWLIEFDDEGHPDREIGLDAHGFPLVAGPNDRNYGFWLDTNMLFSDFAGEPIAKEMFEAAWNRFNSQGGTTSAVPAA